MVVLAVKRVWSWQLRGCGLAEKMVSWYVDERVLADVQV